MKHHFSTTTLFLLVLLFASGCSKGAEDLEKERESNSVMVKIDIRNGSKTRAVTSPTAMNDKELIFEDGYIFFTAQAGTITKHLRIIKDSETPGADEVNIGSLTTGYEIEGVPSNSTNAYMIGNIPAGVTVPTSGNISEVSALIIHVGTQNNASGTTKVSIYGSGKITDPDSPSIDKKKADIHVAVIAGRIEIGKFTALSTGNIDSYEIDAVYTNYYYPEIRLNGSADPATFINNENSMDNYPVGSAIGTPYEGLGLHDWHDTPLASVSKVVQPANGKVWAYNLLAPTIKLVNDDKFARPRIIVRLNNIKLTADATAGETYPDPMYLTMRLKDTETGYEITSFDPGNIYQIDEVIFNESNLYEKPEDALLDVAVTVTLVDWTIVSSGVILN